MKRLDRLLRKTKKLVTTPYTIRNLHLLVILLLGGFLLNPTISSAGTVAEEFITNKQFETGSIVSINQTNPDDIELSTLNNSQYLLGVINQQGSNTVTYAKNSSRVTVALSGEVEVFVTNVNGEIKKGDFIGTSWLEGVGMKALDSNQQKLVGIALADFDERTAQDYGTIETPSGDSEVKIGNVPIRLFDKEGIEIASEQSTTGVEGFLAKIAGQSVSITKVLAVMAIFVLSMLIAGFFVSSSIRGSFVAIGRNPLASSSILNGLLHVTFVAVIVIFLGTALSYVVLVI